MRQDDFYFPSEGRRAENFFALKNPTASAGQDATFRPAKPLKKYRVTIKETDTFNVM
jgi:hypothetical protein